MLRTMKHLGAALAAAASATPLAMAHPGHGLPGESHWHATDLWGFVALALAVGLAIWWRRRR